MKKKKVTIQLKRPYPMLALGIAFTVGGSAFMLHRASTNDRGLVINGIIHLETSSADIFYAVLGLAMCAFAVLTILGFANVARAKEFEIVVSSKSVTFPNPRLWHPDRTVRVPFDDIVLIRGYTQAGNPLVALETRTGTRIVNARWLPDGWNSSRLVEILTERWREHVQR